MGNEGIQQKISDMLQAIFKFSIPTWINFIIGMASSYILTRVFLPEEYAIISLFTTTTNLLMYMVCLGMDGAYIRFYYEPPNGEERRLMLAKMISLFIVILLVLSVVSCGLFGKEFSGSMFGIPSRTLSVLLSINIFSTVIMRFLNITYRMSMNAKKYGVQNILMTSIIRLGALLAIPIAATAEIAIAFQTACLFFLAIIYLLYQWKDVLPERKTIHKGILKQLFSYRGYGELARFSFFSAPSYIVSNANLFFSEQIIRTMVGANAMGVFVAVGYFSKMLEMMRGGFSTFWSAYMYANYEKEQKQIIAVHDYLMYICFCMFFCLIVFKDLIYLLIGEEYRGSKAFFSLLLLGNVLRLCSETTVYGIDIKKRSDLSLLNNIIMCVINIILSWLLTPKFGLIGAASANLMANLIYFILATVIGQYFYKSIDTPVKTGICIIAMLVTSLIPVFVSSTIAQILLLLILLFLVSAAYRKQIHNVWIFIKCRMKT